MDLRNVGILPQHYTASQPKRSRLQSTDMVDVSSYSKVIFLHGFLHMDDGGVST